jgi:hypothetical protein
MNLSDGDRQLDGADKKAFQLTRHALMRQHIGAAIEAGDPELFQQLLGHELAIMAVHESIRNVGVPHIPVMTVTCLNGAEVRNCVGENGEDEEWVNRRLIVRIMSLFLNKYGLDRRDFDMVLGQRDRKLYPGPGVLSPAPI